jgi:hypothetical protein
MSGVIEAATDRNVDDYAREYTLTGEIAEWWTACSANTQALRRGRCLTGPGS